MYHAKEMRNAYKILVEDPKAKGTLGKSTRRWDDNIKMDFKQGVRVWTGFVWLRIGPVGAGIAQWYSTGLRAG
jgi:hypothetical protein